MNVRGRRQCWYEDGCGVVVVSACHVGGTRGSRIV